MKVRDLFVKVKDDPFHIFLAGLVIFFWIAGPFIAQKYLDVSAIKVSFAIIVFYFVAWKFWEFF